MSADHGHHGPSHGNEGAKGGISTAFDCIFAGIEVGASLAVWNILGFGGGGGGGHGHH